MNRKPIAFDCIFFCTFNFDSLLLRPISICLIALLLKQLNVNCTNSIELIEFRWRKTKISMEDFLLFRERWCKQVSVAWPNVVKLARRKQKSKQRKETEKNEGRWVDGNGNDERFTETSFRFFGRIEIFSWCTFCTRIEATRRSQRQNTTRFLRLAFAHCFSFLQFRLIWFEWNNKMSHCMRRHSTANGKIVRWTLNKKK